MGAKKPSSDEYINCTYLRVHRELPRSWPPNLGRGSRPGGGAPLRYPLAATWRGCPDAVSAGRDLARRAHPAPMPGPLPATWRGAPPRPPSPGPRGSPEIPAAGPGTAPGEPAPECLGNLPSCRRARKRRRPRRVSPAGSLATLRWNQLLQSAYRSADINWRRIRLACSLLKALSPPCLPYSSRSLRAFTFSPFLP